MARELCHWSLWLLRLCQAGTGRCNVQLLEICTMVPDAEKLPATLLAKNPDAGWECARCQKLDHDPSLTRHGGFLRNSSFDVQH